MASFQRQNRSYGGDRVHPPYPRAQGPTWVLVPPQSPSHSRYKYTIPEKENIMDETRPLTTKQQQFCMEYLIDMNATAAARRAGYSERTAEQQGYQLLQKTSVKAEIQQLIDERNERVELEASDVVAGLRTLAETATSESARVQAWGLLARHLGMLTDKLDINQQQETILIELERPTPILTLPDESEKAAPHALGDGTGHDEGSKS